MPTKNTSSKILITGFGPFPGVPVNPCVEVLGKYETQAVIKLLDVTYGCVRDFVKSLPEYKAVIHLGVAVKAESFRVESRALNHMSGSGDASGKILPQGRIENDAPGFINSTFPVEQFFEKHKGQLNISISDSAGDYLCNYIYWHSLRKFKNIPVLFLHIPDFNIGGKVADYHKVIHKLEEFY